MSIFLNNCYKFILLLLLAIYFDNTTYSQSLVKFDSLINKSKNSILTDSGITKIVKPIVSGIDGTLIHAIKRLDSIRPDFHRRGFFQLSFKTNRIVSLKKLTSDWLKVNGSISYEIDYQSNIDTPFAQQNVFQHISQAYLNVLVKDQYPLRVCFASQSSNSSYFRNFSSINFQFDQNQFNQSLRQTIKKKLNNSNPLEDTGLIRSSLVKNIRELNSLQSWLNNPSIIQKVVEAKEDVISDKQREKLQKHYHNISYSTIMDSIKGFNKRDSIWSCVVDSTIRKGDATLRLYYEKKHKADSLSVLVSKLESRFEVAKSNLIEQKRNIDKIRNIEQLEENIKGLHIPDSSLPKGYRQLFALRSFGIGRNILDYSELTVKGISISGFQAEYNPTYYIAIASGVVDYRFRDITPNGSSTKQHLTVIRSGWGMKDGNNIIFSYFFGNRQLFNSNSIVNGTDYNGKLIGYSLEGHYLLNKNNEFSAEFAKSSFPSFYQSGTKSSLLSETVSFGERSNEAYYLKAVSFIPFSATKITASFKSIGNNYQSFSVFTTGTTQERWSLKMEQPLWKRRLCVLASLQTNDYINPYLKSNLKSSTVFKSLQATLHIKKWPTLSAGYYPSSQVTKLSDSAFINNLFYTLSVTVTHLYKCNGLSMASLLLLSRFYNKPSDTGFIYFNTRNLLLNHDIYFYKVTSRTSVSVNANSDYTLYTVEEDGNYKVKSWLSLGMGIKYNSQPQFNISAYGYTANVRATIGRIGNIDFMLDKGFIPGSNKRLVSNNLGRITYFKTF